jgi:hypothetical protein
LRAGRGFRTADFAADLFFFFDLAIVIIVSAILIDWRRENGRLIKNVYPTTQADSPKTFRSLRERASAVTSTIPAGFMTKRAAMKIARRFTGSPVADLPLAD